MKFWISGLIALILAGCAPVSTEQPAQATNDDTQPQPAIALQDLGPATEWQNETWLNTEAPLYLEELRGQVILLEMWTFG
ncbi:MAG: hypothetical protein ISR60_06995 [Anaerolineales bacterium]|nr:hypothetical protein [Anaerolineales bacterium]